jgi:hypothetical protein
MQTEKSQKTLCAENWLSSGETRGKLNVNGCELMHLRVDGGLCWKKKAIRFDTWERMWNGGYAQGRPYRSMIRST